MPGNDRPTSSAAAEPGLQGVTASRVVAAEILAEVRRGELLDAGLGARVESLDQRDRRWVQELVYGMLRRRGFLDAVLDLCVRGGLAKLDRDLADILRLGAYQLRHMDSVPAYAAIGQTVELVKRRHGIGASRLANAVLRRMDREAAVLDVQALARCTDPLDRLSVEYSHPRWLIARWVARWGETETRALLQANNREASIVLRPFGVVREQLEASLEAAGVETVDAPLVGDSVQLRGGVALAELGAYRQGLFFVQDPAATLVARYAAVPAGGTVIDLCAAPGGKALELSRLAGTVIAVDRSAARLQRVRQNLERLDVRNIAVVVADARDAPFGATADAVLVDAPCTGTGTFRRHPDARWRLKVSDLAVASSTQRQILRAAAGLVRPGGLLIYGTCSLEPEENDEQVEQFLRENDGWVLEPPAVGVVPAEVIDAGRLRVLPQRQATDGAFAARLRRAAEA